MRWQVEWIEFIKALGVGAVVLILIAGCTSTVTPTPSSTGVETSSTAKSAQASLSAPTSSAAAKAAPKDLVVLATSIGAEQPMPNKNTGTDATLWAPIFDFLFQRDPNTGKPGAGLVTKWTPSPDFKVWDLTLQARVEFHEGNGELTSEDVKFTLDQLVVPKDSTNTEAVYLRGKLASIETPNPYRVILNFNMPVWDLPYHLDNSRAAIPIISKKWYEKVGAQGASEHPIGSGPYRLVGRSRGEHVKFEAVDKHWRVTPQFKTLTIKLVPEMATRLAMVRAGEADIASVSLERASDARNAGLRTIASKGGNMYFALLWGQFLSDWPSFNPKLPWVGDPKDAQSVERALKVRQAMNLAINRQEMVDTLLKGEGKMVANFDWGEQWPSFNPAWKPYPYDPAKAKALLAEAGYPDGFPFKLMLILAPGKVDTMALGEATATYLEKIGIKVTRETADQGQVRDLAVNRHKVPPFAGGMIYALAGFDFPSQMLRVTADSQGSLNMLAENAYFDTMIPKMEAEADEAKRVQMEREVGDFIYNNYLSIPLASSPTVWAVGNKVGDWPLLPGSNYELQQLEYVTTK